MTSQLTPRSRKATFPSLGELAAAAAAAVAAAAVIADVAAANDDAFDPD